jgi:hypothetical protein
MSTLPLEKLLELRLETAAISFSVILHCEQEIRNGVSRVVTWHALLSVAI